jgi:hypothetical protein
MSSSNKRKDTVRFHVPRAEALEGEPIPKRLLVVGSPRSGTMYFTQFLRRFGMRVSHERMGEDGTVNAGWLAPKLEEDPLIVGRGRQHYEFEKIIHLVRNPLACIDSLSREMHDVFWRWQRLHSQIEVPPDDIERIAAFWVFWTDACQHMCDEYVRLEDIAHLGDVENRGIHFPAKLQTDALGSLKNDIEARMLLYGYQADIDH